MSFDRIEVVRRALKRGDRKKARALLKPMLQDNPTADVWCLAAQACADGDTERAVACLKKALELDEWHPEANRLLLKMEGARPKDAEFEPMWLGGRVDKPARKSRTTVTAAAVTDRAVRKQREKVASRKYRTETEKRFARRQMWTRLGCVAGMIMSITSSFFVLSVLGAGSPINDILCRTGLGDCPVVEIDGVPIEEIDDAVLRVEEPDRVRRLNYGNTQADTLESGITHEWTFSANRGGSFALLVQFMSPNATGVGRNVAVLDSAGSDAEDVCERQQLIGGDTGVAFTCRATRGGEWSVRIFGRQGESTGAYVVSLEPLAF